MTKNPPASRETSIATSEIRAQKRVQAELPRESVGICELIYWPEKDWIIPLTNTELTLLKREEKLLDNAIGDVQKANQSGDRDLIARAKEKFAELVADRIGEAQRIVQVDPRSHSQPRNSMAPQMKGGGPLTEIVRFGGKKWSFIPADLVEAFKHQKAYSFSEARKIVRDNTTAQPVSGEDISGLKQPWRTEGGQLNGQRLKEQFGKVSAKITKDWKIVEPKNDQFSIHNLLSAPARLAVGEQALDQFDAWVASFNDNLRWVADRHEQLRREIQEQLENEQEYSFDSDLHGRVKTAVEAIWGGDEEQKAWVEETRNRPYPADQREQQTLRRKLALEIGARKAPESQFDASAEAQLMRYTYGVTAATDFDLKKGRFSAEGKAELDLALFEAKAQGHAMLPDEKGQSIDIPVKITEYTGEWEPTDYILSPYPTFAFAKTFLAPESMKDTGGLFRSWLSGKGIDVFKHINPELKIQLIGHADKVGTDAYNQGLSERRARVVYGYLTRQSSHWLAMFDVPQSQGGWGAEELQQMLNTLGATPTLKVDNDCGPVTRQAVSVFQKKTNRPNGRDDSPKLGPPASTLSFNPQPLPSLFPSLKTSARPILLEDGNIHLTGSNLTLQALVEAYLDKYALADTITPDFFEEGKPYIGVGESHPEVNTEAPEVKNRRVEFMLKQATYENVVKEEKEVPLGDLRLKLEAHLGGYVGANLMAAADIHFDVNQGVLHARGVRAGMENADPGAGTEAEVFAGAKAEIGCKGVLEWKSPEPPPGATAAESQNLDTIPAHGPSGSCLPCHDSTNLNLTKSRSFVELGSVGYTATGQVGVNLSGKIQIGFDPESKKFVVKLEASAALGPGFGGKLAFTVGVEHTYNFIAMVYTQLRDNDFSLVDFFDKERQFSTFDLFCSWSYKMLLQGNLVGAQALAVGAIGARVISDSASLLESWRNLWEDQKLAQKLINNINQNADFLKFTLPEVKGRILYLLVNPGGVFYQLGTWFDSLQTDRKKAVLKVLAWIQSQRDYQEVLEHMGVNIPQGKDDSGKKDRVKKNKDYLLEFLEGFGVTAEKWGRWYKSLAAVAEKSTNGPVQKRQSPAEF